MPYCIYITAYLEVKCQYARRKGEGQKVIIKRVSREKSTYKFIKLFYQVAYLVFGKRYLNGIATVHLALVEENLVAA